MADAAVAPARSAAWHVLLAVERGTAHSDDQLRSPRVDALSREDRNLTTELVRGTLRWQTVLDREIADRLRDPSASMHLGVILALRLGAYQLLFLDRIPAHAAVHESVELAKSVDGPAAGGLVNAILRRLIREKSALLSLRSDPAAAYPGWMVARWRRAYGDAATQGICAFGQQAPPATHRLAPEEESPGTGEFLTRAARGEGSGTRVQDEASQLVGELAALHAGDSLLDACAAPGGKTAILLERNPTAQIFAFDRSAPRLRITGRRFAWPENVHFAVADAASLPAGATYSSALCDMPCSGTGTLARNPEIRHRLQEADLQEQAQRQVAIATRVLATLRPGGRMLYSTCSLEREENEHVIEALLGANPRVQLEPIVPLLGELAAQQVLTPAGHTRLVETAVRGPYLRTVPGVHACDGFFAAVLSLA